MYKHSILTFGKILTFPKKLFQFSIVCRKDSPPNQPRNVPNLSCTLYQNSNKIPIHFCTFTQHYPNNIHMYNITLLFNNGSVLSTVYTMYSKKLFHSVPNIVQFIPNVSLFITVHTVYQNVIKSIISLMFPAFMLVNFFCNDRIILFHTTHTCIQPYLD